MRVADYGDEQAARGVDRESDVNRGVFMKPAVDELDVEIGHLQQGLDGAEGDQVVDVDIGQPFRSLDAGTQGEETGGVGGSVEGVLGGGGERLAHAAGDFFAQIRDAGGRGG